MPSLRKHPIVGLNRAASKFGCPKLIALERPTTKPAQIQYLDLLPTAKRNAATPLLPQAVAEFQGRPVMYFLDGATETFSSDRLLELQQRLANRSDHAVLAVARPGDLTLFPINLDRQELQAARWETISATDPTAPFLFQSIASGTRIIKGSATSSDPVFTEIHRLLGRASSELAKPEGPLDGLTVLSLTGRALFFRFLMDRRIVREEDITRVCPPIKNGDLKGVFSDADRAAHVSAWLDETFNGDLLPLVEEISTYTPPNTRRALYKKAYQHAGKATGGAIFTHLEAILRGWQQMGDGRFQLTFQIDWDDLNFRHIPVGVLSQVYETFSHQWDGLVARDTSVHYTPKNIAALVIDQTLAGLSNVHQARILDPACGAGIFLVLAFRELVRRHWERDKKRPGTKIIHKVLYKQLCGFEISESALRLAALALYITAIELNEIIRPPEELKAPIALKNLVLFNFAEEDQAETRHGFVLGSLGSKVPSSFNESFDAVVGNPPWTRLRSRSEAPTHKQADKKRIAALNGSFTEIGRNVLQSRGFEELAKGYHNPDNVPDLPFVWRAMQWARKDGIIGIALDARLIFKQTEAGKTARNALFQSLAITGILNGSALEETKVWPKMKMPWLLLWARNATPPPNHSFHFLTPVREDSLTAKGEFRIDYQSAHPIPVREVIKRGWLLKALAIGTTLDLQVFDKIVSNGFASLAEVWNSLSLPSGSGYHLGKGNDPAHLLTLKDFEMPSSGFEIEFSHLISWAEKYRTIAASNDGKLQVTSPRKEQIYRAPLVIIPQTPGEDRVSPKACISEDRDLAYSQSFYGYSSKDHPEAILLSSTVYILAHSLLWTHFALMRSSRLGASFRTFIKDDFEAFPFPSPAQMKQSEKKDVLRLAALLRHRGSHALPSLDAFVFKLYGLNSEESETVRDTVEFFSQYRSARLPAISPPSAVELSRFAQCVSDTLQPFFEVADEAAAVEILPLVGLTDQRAPWRFMSILLKGDKFTPTNELIAKLMRRAAQTNASRVVLLLPGSGLIVGMLNQRRFWSRSRARLCALHISTEHLERAFPLSKPA